MSGMLEALYEQSEPCPCGICRGRREVARLRRALERAQSYVIDYSEGRLDATMVIPVIAREINEALDPEESA